ncbi:MAG: hypothetical protein WC342_07845 [Methanoregula sp.]|jgi:hypothetical protein
MISKFPEKGTIANIPTESATTYLSCPIYVGRARLLYGIVKTSGIDVTREVIGMW